MSFLYYLTLITGLLVCVFDIIVTITYPIDYPNWFLWIVSMSILIISVSLILFALNITIFIPF